MIKLEKNQYIHFYLKGKLSGAIYNNYEVSEAIELEENSGIDYKVVVYIDYENGIELHILYDDYKIYNDDKIDVIDEKMIDLLGDNYE